MTLGFDPTNPPFDRLAQQELEEVLGALDIAYFRPGEVIVAAGKGSEALHVVIKGSVESRSGDAVEARLGAKDSFDPRAVVHGAAGEDFVAAEETLCHLVPRDLVLALIRRNPAFAGFFYAEISRKFDALAGHRADGMESVLRARVRDTRYSPAVFVDAGATVEEAGQRMRDANVNALFVRDRDRIGVVTGMNLSKGLVLQRLPLETPVRELCHFDVVAVDGDDFIVEALIQMTRHNKRRIAVRSGDLYQGFLEDIDILGLFAGNSQLIPGRIERARGLDDLADAARDIQLQVERLHRQGIKVDRIAEITSDLNRRLLVKVFDLTAPVSIKDAGCLLAMGSEGRGEQTVRTDQDNGLLLERALPEADLAAFRTAFTEALDRCGFPPCPGNVMVRNPIWSQPVDSFIGQLRAWTLERTGEAAMNLAIGFDAIALTGRAELLTRAKSALFGMMQGEAVVLGRFAHLIETFATPGLGMLDAIMATVGVASDEIDIKRAGTFPIVHGVRAMAIKQGIRAPSTAGRIDQLVEQGRLESAFGRELISALHVCMEFRLRSQLAALRRGTLRGESLVHLSQLTAADRDILRDALRVVRQLRELIRRRFNLAAY